MLLSGHNISHYLLDKNFITTADFVGGSVKIYPLSSRNHCFLVRSPNGPSLFIKQVRAMDADRITTLRTEANIYWLAQNDQAYIPLSPFIPQLKLYDYVYHILVTEALEDADNLLEHYYRVRNFSPDLAQQKASLLATLHRDVTLASENGQSRQLFQENIPAVFLLEESQLASWSDQKPSGELFLKLIRESANYLSMIQEVRQEWTSTCLIHNDLKNTNFLVNNSEQPALHLIDWEVTSIGDPCWDVAAIFQSYFLFWIEYNAQQQAGYSLSEPGKYTGFPIEEMQESMQVFWQRYAQLMQWSDTETEANLLKSMKFCALKLIHTCTEASQQDEHMQPTSAAMLQLSFNILQDPNQAIEHLILNTITV